MTAFAELAEQIGNATAVEIMGAGTQRGIGGAVDASKPIVEVRAPTGIVSLDPADMTVRVLAGTPVGVLSAALAEVGQECPLDPENSAATVGGVLACGCSGIRRIRYGPIRDRVLEVRFITGGGRLVRGGGPTVKNVSGYDFPRLMVGSHGTLGMLVEVVLKTQPIANKSSWYTSELAPDLLRTSIYRPACIAWNGKMTYVLLEGHEIDVLSQASELSLEPAQPPPHPIGEHRGRISIDPTRIGSLAKSLGDIKVPWLAEIGVGTMHVATNNAAELHDARLVAHGEGGWLLREAGAPLLDPFGAVPSNREVMGRIRDAFDPSGKLNPGRLPFARFTP